jgi:hypothetical protein
MRKIMRRAIATIVFVIVVCSSTGCEENLLTSSARTGAASFLTTVINGALAG